MIIYEGKRLERSLCSAAGNGHSPIQPQCDANSREDVTQALLVQKCDDFRSIRILHITVSYNR